MSGDGEGLGLGLGCHIGRAQRLVHGRITGGDYRDYMVGLQGGQAQRLVHGSKEYGRNTVGLQGMVLRTRRSVG